MNDLAMSEQFGEKMSNSVSWLKALLPIVIVSLHAFYPETNTYQFKESSTEDIMYLLSRILTSFAVPCFFFISGYLFFLNEKKEIRSKLKSRVFSLLVPYLLWNTIYLLLQVIKPLVFSSLFNINTYTWDLKTIISAYWNFDGANPIDAPLWYIRDLMILCLFTPLIYKLNKKFPWVILIWIAISYFKIGYSTFLAGTWCVMHRDLLKKITECRVVTTSSCILTLFFITIALITPPLYKCLIIKNIYIYNWVLLAVSLSMRLPSFNNYGTIRILHETSFWVYAIHALIIGLIHDVIFKLSYPSNDLMFITYFYLKIILTYVLSLILFYSLKKTMPSIASLLTKGKFK